MVLRIISDAFVVFGLFFAFAGVVGLLRMPDAYTRMQSSTNIVTLGLFGAVIGGLLHAVGVVVEGNPSLGWAQFVKIAIIGLFAILTNPIASHSICKAAYKHGVRPDKDFVCDKYGEDEFDE